MELRTAARWKKYTERGSSIESMSRKHSWRRQGERSQSAGSKERENSARLGTWRPLSVLNRKRPGIVGDPGAVVKGFNSGQHLSRAFPGHWVESRLEGSLNRDRALMR
jgi:hypothetical protein